MRAFKLAAGLSGLVLVLGACSSGGDAQGDATPAQTSAPVESVKIGSVHPLTGGLAADGLQMDAAAQLAAADINAAGGIKCMDGAQLEIVSADSTGTPEVGQSEAERLIQAGAIALVGPYQSAVASNMATVAERNGVPFVIDVAVADDILMQGYRNTFRIQPNASTMGSQAAVFLKELTDAAGMDISKIAVLHEQSAFGTSVYEAFAASAAPNGWTVEPVISYDAFGVTDLTTEVTKVKAASPDVIVVTGYYGDGVLAAEAINAVNPGVKLVYGIASGAFDNPGFPADVAGMGEGFFNVNYHLDVTNPVTQDIASRFEQSFGEPMKTSATLSYEAVRVIGNALESSCSNDPMALRDAIASTNLDSILATVGPIVFNEQGENANATPIVLQVQDGAVLQVFPESVAEAGPRLG